jgi:hypothetical protein
MIIHRFFISAFVVFIFLSCEKERSCESCKDGNKLPIAIAGPDQVITLPTEFKDEKKKHYSLYGNSFLSNTSFLFLATSTEVPSSSQDILPHL